MASRESRRRRFGWLLIAGVAAALIIGSIAVTLILQSGASPAPTPIPSRTATYGAGSGANGCMAGPGITAAQLEQIRATMDFTPTGAVEFLGAFTQFYSAADPTYREGIEQVATEMTSGSVRDALSAAKSTDSPDAGNTHAAYLGRGYYNIVSASSKEVVVDVVAQQFRNGEPIPASDSGTVFAAQRYTVKPTPAGWLITGADKPSQTIQQLIDSGQRFRGGC